MLLMEDQVHSSPSFPLDGWWLPLLGVEPDGWRDARRPKRKDAPPSVVDTRPVCFQVVRLEWVIPLGSISDGTAWGRGQPWVRSNWRWPVTVPVKPYLWVLVTCPSSRWDKYYQTNTISNAFVQSVSPEYLKFRWISIIPLSLIIKIINNLN